MVWEKMGKINYENMDWGDVQMCCYELNKKCFVDLVVLIKIVVVLG